MKLMEMDLQLPFLPEEIITNILNRLPVKSLLRFQCVCNRFKNLTTTPSFIFDHLHHSIRQNPSLIFQRNSMRDGLNFYLLDPDMQLRQIPSGPSIDFLKSGRIIGSSNGLLCVRIDLPDDSPPNVFLWNPAIREVMQVPGSRTINDFMFDCVLGFGFCPIAKDYKIVIIYADTETGDVVSGFEVYSLSTCSWKEIETSNLEQVSFRSDSVTTNGSIFWRTVKRGVAYDGGDDINFILSFDLAMEEFTLIPQPPSSRSTDVKLTVYENRLAILEYSRNSSDTLIELWVMKEEENDVLERWSWSKKFTFGPYPYSLNPLTIWKNHIVCDVFKFSPVEFQEENDDEEENDELKAGIFLFNLTSNELQVFPSRRCSDYHDVFNYVECLVPVRNIHIEEP